MPKSYTFPSLFDDTIQLNITKLRAWKYLALNQVRSGRVNWSINGEEFASITIHVDTTSDSPYIELDYKYKNQPRKYRLGLVSTESNLGKGIIWYFVCPKTKKRCRILYSIDGYFMHREAFHGCMYNSQTYSKQYRQLDKTLGAYFRIDDLYEMLRQKNFKKTYAGKPTKRYLRIIRQIEKAESIPYIEIQRLMLSK